MSDDRKTKRQLAEELSALRRKVARLEAKIKRAQRATRKPIPAAGRRKRPAPTPPPEQTPYDLLDNAPIGHYRSTPDGRILHVNAALVEILGYPDQETLLATRAVELYVKPADRQQWQEAVEREPLMRGFETHLRKYDGTDIWVRESACAVRDDAGQVLYYEGIVEDITSLKQAEEELVRAAREWQITFDSTSDAICLLDRDQRVTRANLAMRTLFQGGPELVGRRCWEIIHGTDGPIPECPLLRMKHTQKRESMEMAFNDRTLDVTTDPILDQQGNLIGTVHIIRDITERKRTEEALNKERDLMKRLMETSPAGVVLVNREGQITFANTRAEQVLGLSRAEIIGRVYNDPLWRITDYDGNPFPEKALPFRRVMETGKPVFDVRHAIEWPDGRRVLLSINGAPLISETGEPAGMIATVEDITARVQAEKALRENEAALRSIFRAVPVGIGLVDRNRTLLRINDRICEMTGYSRNELIGQSARLIYPSDEEFERVGREKYAQVRTRGTGSIETRWRRKDGRIIDVLLSSTLIDPLDPDSNVVFTALDITERKQSEEKLREESSFRNSIIKNAAEGLCVCHPIPDYPYVAFTVWNDRMTEITGYTMEEINRLGWYQTMYPDPEIQQRAVERMARMRQGDDLIAEEWVITRADGEKRTVLISTSVLETENREPHVLAVMQDITERKRAEEALRESEEKFRSLAEQLPNMIFINRGGRVVYANKKCEEIMGYTREEFYADDFDFLSLTAPEYVELVKANYARHMRGEEVPPYEYALVTKDGKRIAAILSTKLIDYEGEKSILGIITDITERKQIEAQMRQQERLAAVGQLAGGIAHDFNNLLTAITLYAQMPLSRPDLPPDVRRALETVLVEARQAAELVQQILDFSRRSPIETRPVNLGSFIKEAVRVLQRTIPEHISPVVEIEPGEHIVNADPTRIQQMLMNIVVNARDAMPNGGTLRVTLRRADVRPGETPPLPEMTPGEWICLSISDTGTGIPPDVLPHIFEPFFTTKAEGRGVGLGLAQVYGIVKQHGGHISVETEVGKGSTFRVYLPAYHVPEHKGETEAESPALSGSGQTILLVEDNERIREGGQAILESLGYRVLTAANGRQALELYREEAIDLLLTDVVMPEMGGVELARQLRKTHPDLKVVAVTGHLLLEDAEALKQEGIHEIVKKPFDVPALTQAIHRLLSGDATPSA